ncbi:MAG: hypothetical protein Q9187_008675, partial [Circinaria calcarea]
EFLEVIVESVVGTFVGLVVEALDEDVVEALEKTVVGTFEETAEELGIAAVGMDMEDVLKFLVSLAPSFETLTSPFEEPVGSVVELRVVMVTSLVTVEHSVVVLAPLAVGGGMGVLVAEELLELLVVFMRDVVLYEEVAFEEVAFEEIAFGEVALEEVALEDSVLMDEEAALTANAVLGEGVVLNKDVVLTRDVSLDEDVAFTDGLVPDEDVVLADDGVLDEAVVLTDDVELNEGETGGENVVLNEGVGPGRDVVLYAEEVSAASQPSLPRTLRKRTSFNMAASWGGVIPSCLESRTEKISFFS